MAVIETTDATALDEIRVFLDPALTAAEVPDDVINTRLVLKSANRYVLLTVGMTATEYAALAEDDVRREVFEEAVLRRCTRELVPVVAQLIAVNANGLLTRFQRIDWLMRRKQLDLSIQTLLGPYVSGAAGGGFYEAVTRTKHRWFDGTQATESTLRT